MKSRIAKQADNSLMLLAEKKMILDDNLGSRAFESETYEPGDVLRKSIAVHVEKAAFTTNLPHIFVVADWCCSTKVSLDKVSLAALGEEGSDRPHPQPKAPNPSIKLPSLGSTWHATGRCNPCAFFHKGGCVEGSECKFCHLCQPGTIEEKRRSKRRLVRAKVYRESRSA
mmetsp:Transcript_7135/g.11414  ORF Transcript_7135/g.11414 Transcript_7135/m.11414 type:complete len:170 (+) Transcript_7135:48-557(+)